MSKSTIQTQLQLNDGTGKQVPISTGTWVTQPVQIEEHNLLSLTLGMRGATGNYALVGGYTGTVQVQTTNEIPMCFGATGSPQAFTGRTPGINGYSGAQYWNNYATINLANQNIQVDYNGIGAEYVRLSATGLQGSGTIDCYLTAKHWENATPTFVPSNISGNVLWLRSDKGITLNAGASVSQWIDQSYQGLVFTQSTAGQQPAYSSKGGNNGLPYLTLTAASQQFLNSASNVVPNGNDRTVFAVVQVNGTVGGTIIGFHTASDIASCLYWFASPVYYVYTDGVAVNNGISSTALPITGTPCLLEWTYHIGSQVFAAVNGVNQQPMLGAVVSNADTGTNGTDIGYSNQYFNGNIYEIIVYNRILTTFETQQVSHYLNTRYSINGV